MQMFIIFFIFFIPFSGFSQNSEWKVIYPIADCQKLPLHYQKTENGNYQVQFDSVLDSDQNPKIYEVQNLNDLSSLTEIIIAKRSKYCPEDSLESNIGLEQRDSLINCFQNEFFSDDYLEFIGFTIDYINKNDLQCENIIPLIKLQDEISQLKHKELIQYRDSMKPGHVILKLFLNKEYDSMINHFEACGGKEGSDQFIKNMILMEASKSCVVPQLINWEEAQNVALNIAGEYKGTNLLKISKKVDELTYTVSMAFTEKVLHKEVNEILGDIFAENEKMGSKPQNADEFINGYQIKSSDGDANKDIQIPGLDSYDKLPKVNNKDNITDYISYVFSVDASIEVGKNAIPLFLISSFSDKLPSEWSQKEKEYFIHHNFVPKADRNYQKCMQERLEFSQYGKLEGQDLFNHRIEKKKEYCDAHPKQCEEGNCEGIINLLHPQDDVSDTDIISACVLQSIAISIEPLLESVISAQKEDFKEEFDLTETMIKQFSAETWDDLISCANSKIQKATNSSVEIDITKSEKPLQKISPSEFENIISDCSDNAEAEVSAKFVNFIIINDDTFKETFSSEDGIAQTTAQEIISESFRPCVEKQFTLSKIIDDPRHPTHGIKEVDTLLCTPLVEMNTSLRVVEKQLKDMLIEERIATLDDVNENEVIKLFKACGENAKKEAFNDLGALSSQSSTPINTLEESNNYLDENPSLFTCIQTAISDVSFLVAGKQYEAVIEEQKGNVNDINYLTSLKPDVQRLIKDCLNGGIQQQKNWSGFLKFNEDDGLDKLQERCEMEANKYVVPKLVIHETHGELKNMIKTGFINDSSEIGNIIYASAIQLKNNYQIPDASASNGTQKIDYYMGEALKLHLDQGGSATSFVDEVSVVIETETIKKVHHNLLSEIQNHTTDMNQKKKFMDFGNSFPASCLQDIYNKFMKNSTESTDDPMKLEELAKYLQQGLNYYERKSPSTFSSELTILKNQCSHMDQFKNENEFYQSKFYEIILKGEIYTQFKESFSKQIFDQIDQTEKSLKNPNLAIKKKYTKKLREDMQKLFDKTLTAENFDKIIFKDGEILSFAQNNLEKLLSADPRLKDQLSEKLLTKLYVNDSKSSFNSEFAKAQIIASIGLSGVDDAIKDSNDRATILKLAGWRLGPNNYAMQSTKELFDNPENIEKFLDWNGLSEKQRKLYSNTIAQNAVIGSVRNQSYTKGTKENLLQMYYQENMKARPVPQDTNPTPFENMAKSLAESAFKGKLENMKKKLDQYTVVHGYNNYNLQLEKIVDEEIKHMNLDDNNRSIDSNQFLYGQVIRPRREDVRQMLREELRHYMVEKTIATELEEYKYSNGKTFVEKIEDKIQSKTYGKMF